MKKFLNTTRLALICGAMLFAPMAMANTTSNTADKTNPLLALTAEQIKTPMGTFNAFGYLIDYLPATLEKLDFKTIEQQAKQGDKNAQFYLAKFYETGVHVPKDIAQAIQWYQKSAEQHHSYALNNLGYYYFVGEDIAKDEQKGIELWTIASQQNNLHAIMNLGQTYLEKNDAQGMIWFKKASEQNFAPAFLVLSWVYENGLDGVEVDKDLAYEYLQKSAEMGYAPAQYTLANRYQFGTLLTLDVEQRRAYIKKAYYWANRACVNGEKSACRLKEYYDGAIGSIDEQ